jgi:hypothetical protein
VRDFSSDLEVRFADGISRRSSFSFLVSPFGMSHAVGKPRRNMAVV